MEAASQDDIRRWLQVGLGKNATHMIVTWDTWEDEPVYVMPEENVKEKVTEQSKSGKRIMEVYNLSLSIEDQLKETRAFHL